jgi:hypothetical protein
MADDDCSTARFYGLTIRSILKQATPLAVALSNLESIKKGVGKYANTVFFGKRIRQQRVEEAPLHN